MRPRNVPRCAACGKRLAKYDPTSHRNMQISSRNYRTQLHLDHEAILPKEYSALTADGEAPTRGTYGDNLTCSAPCAQVLVVRLVIALGGMEVLKLLPPHWRHR